MRHFQKISFHVNFYITYLNQKIINKKPLFIDTLRIQQNNI